MTRDEALRAAGNLARGAFLAALLVGIFGTGWALGAASNAERPAPRTTVAEVEEGVMCPTCDTTLNNSSSPSAERMRVLVRELVAQGLTKEEVEDELVRQYGGDDSILAMPRPRGLGLYAWLVPGLVALAAVVSGVLVVIRWRRRRLALDRASRAVAPVPGAPASRVPAGDR